MMRANVAYVINIVSVGMNMLRKSIMTEDSPTDG